MKTIKELQAICDEQNKKDSGQYTFLAPNNLNEFGTFVSGWNSDCNGNTTKLLNGFYFNKCRWIIHNDVGIYQMSLESMRSFKRSGTLIKNKFL